VNSRAVETKRKFGQHIWNSSDVHPFIRDLGGLRVQHVLHVNKGFIAGSLFSWDHLLHSKKAL